MSVGGGGGGGGGISFWAQNACFDFLYNSPLKYLSL